MDRVNFDPTTEFCLADLAVLAFMRKIIMHAQLNEANLDVREDMHCYLIQIVALQAKVRAQIPDCKALRD